MKKVLVIVPTLQLGGQERVAVETVEILSKKYDVTLMVFDSSNAVYSTNQRIVDITIPAHANKLIKVLNVIRRIVAVRKYKRNNRIDVSISFGMTANLINSMTRCGDKVLVEIRGFRSINNTIIDKAIYKKADAIVGCSKVICGEFGKLFPKYREKTHCVYNPLEFENIINKAKEPVDDYDFSGKVIVSHGRLNEVKNYECLIEAFYKLKATYKDIKLLIIGEGDQRSVLEKKIKELLLEDSVTLCGLRENPFKYISKATVYVLSSLAEGFPNALVEGMVFLPVVSTDCKSGPREILTGTEVGSMDEGYSIEQYGILTKLDGRDSEITAENIAAGINNLLQDEKMYDKMKNASNCRAMMFDTESYLNNICSVIEGN